jgi:hypothetical protein
MADNIKIVGNILDTQLVTRYDADDLNLLSPLLIKEDFGQQNDYIEYFTYDAGGNLLNINYNYRDFKLPNTSYVDPSSGSLPIIEIDPIKDLQNLGYSSGEFKVQYNFFNNRVSNPQQSGLFIKEISADRTELRVGSTVLTNEQIESGSLSLINEYSSSAYFIDYIADFGNNTQATVVNVALNKIESGYEILLKLYQPLSVNIQEKNTLWIVQEKVNPYVFDINLDKLIISAPGPQLKGPNFAIDIPNQNNVATSYQTYSSLINSVQNISTASYQQLLSIMVSQSIDINVDYSDLNNFIFFSSAEQRLKNFYSKIKDIEDYNNDITYYSSNAFSSSLSSSFINTATSSIDIIIAGFDGYEYYLYFESGSTSWPKTNNSLPYINATTASATSWYNAATSSADSYDNENQNNLVYTIPSFIKDDPNNVPYLTFLNMVGHYFDNIWIYLSAITDINLANNNLEKGISKDLVYHVLESLGTKLYNQYGDVDNVDYLIGNSGSAYYTGNDTQAFTSTGSYLNTIPRKDLLAESYKRIYHNLPLLLKTKGTAYGLQTLVSVFGVTGSTLPIKEYGGDLKSNTLDEFNNDKVRVVSGSIVTGSVLSPYISVVQYPTASSQFRTNDLNYVDISFSPQDKIDIYTSASIVAVSSSWTIDDIIGDPGYQYSSSYSALETARITYLSPLSASQLPYTSSVSSGSIGATDYNSFIRLIQFFDNSLFKMLQDFIPARTSLSTGVTISSPILERNKWSYANPSATSEIEVQTGSIAGPTIGTEYTDIYYGLTGSKAAYYNGVFTGSYINTYKYFESGTFNPYLLPTSSTLTPGQIYVFNHTDYNVMLNNVSSSLISRNRQLAEPIFGTQNFILTPVQLQDSYETLKTHQLSRYDGVKLSSAKYNTYTDGDTSYGKTAVIDKNVLKLGLFSEVVNSRFLPKRNNVALKYLVDIEGNLTELNLRNKHWVEVQNTFIQNDTGSISQFNNQLYSNQKITDGEKSIFDSGYTYEPILYFGPTGSDNILAFLNTVDLNAYLATAQNTLNPNSYISGSGGSNTYPLSGSYVYNIFDRTIEGSQYFRSGSVTQFPTYSVQETGDHLVQISLPFDYTVGTSPINNATWSLQVWKSGSSGETLLQKDVQYFVAGDPISSTLYFTYYTSGDFYFTLSEAIPSTNIVISSAFVTGYSGNACNVISEDDNINAGNSLTITAGTTSGNVTGNTPMGMSTTNYIKGSYLVINGQYATNGSVLTIGGTQLTVVVDNNCDYYAN